MIIIGAQEIVDFLKTCTEPVTRKQIAEGLEWNPERVSHILKKLLKFNEVNFIEHDRNNASKLVGYILTRRTRFFFLIED